MVPFHFIIFSMGEGCSALSMHPNDTTDCKAVNYLAISIDNRTT